ncbi:MAG: LacI family transcriptional regulator [Lachnospiraceae bacterium]|nr:LacI family transcriptional regulator [Lachnospiraceae bacterium]
MEKHDGKIIGLLIEDLFTDYAKDIIHSIMNAIGNSSDIRLVVMAGKHDENPDLTGSEHCYKSIYNVIYRFEEVCHFDGLILALGSMSESNEVVWDGFFGERFKHTPKVFISSSRDNEITVNYDNESGIREAIDYLVKVKGFTKIGMLGGREDNSDANERKEIFSRCLYDNNLRFREEMYEKTYMAEDCEKAVESLLDRNPGIQAIFCVNDAVARGLYSVMARRNLVPGKDISVFGFDNTRMAAEMTPPLSSIGANSDAPSQAAVELLLKLIDGEKVSSVLIPTKLFGRESLKYEMYDYKPQEIMDVTPEFIDKLFDDCFYRYKNELYDRENVDLKRLFHEFMTRMLSAMKHRYMSLEEFEEAGHLIDIFFENGAMNYTDADKFVKSVDRLQGSINRAQKSVAANVRINRLFARSKDRAILTLAQGRVSREHLTKYGRGRMKDFLADVVDYTGNGRDTLERIISNFDKIGLENAALYLFTEPVIYNYGEHVRFPSEIELRCVMKAGELFILPSERRKSSLEMIFSREELALRCKGFVTLPVFYGTMIFGLIVCELAGDIADRGDYVADLVGRTLYIAGHLG